MAELFEAARTKLATVNPTSITTCGIAPEKRVIIGYSIRNYGVNVVNVSLAFGPAGALLDDHYEVKSFPLDPAPAAGKTGGKLVHDTGEKHVLMPGDSMVVTADVANTISVEAVYLKRTLEP